MKLALRIAIVVAILAIAAAARAQSVAPPPVDVVPSPKISQPLTMDEALALAFQYNPDLAVATAQVNKARGVVEEARARFYPQFTGQVSQLYQKASNIPNPFPGAGQPPTINITPGSETAAQASFLLPLDVSGKLTYASDIAKYQFQIQYQNLLRQSEQLIAQVKRNYYEVLRACGQAETAQAAVDVAALRLKNTQSRFEAGTVPKFDVTTAQVDLANLNQQLIAAKSRVNIAQANFSRVLGISPDSSIQVAKVDVPVTSAQVDVVASSKVAKERRPEVRAQQLNIALSRKNIKLQRTGYLPSLAVNGNYSIMSQASAFSSGNTNWMVTLAATQNIWDGGVTKARIDQAYGDLQVANASLDQAELGVSQEVATAALTLEEAARRTTTTAQSVALAEEALRLANVRYEAGIAVLVEVTNAESQLTQARFNLVNAEYDYAIALADLQRATATQPELEKLRLIDCSAVYKGVPKQPAAK